jgi:hypothetical protein
LKTVRLPSEGRPGIDRYSVALVTDAVGFSSLLDAFHEVEAENRQLGRSFLTLDDLNQCLYTSGHTLGSYGFDDDLVYPENETPEAVAEYQAAVLAATLKGLSDPDRTVSWDQLQGTLFAVPEDIDALNELNRNPDLLLDDVHVVQCIPVASDEGPLANLPNGYFTSDWTPFQCLAVVRRICQQHGYAFIGIGASTLGFLSVLDDEGERDTAALISDLQHLYGQADHGAWQQLDQTLRRARHLILGYTENFADLID